MSLTEMCGDGLNPRVDATSPSDHALTVPESPYENKRQHRRFAALAGRPSVGHASPQVQQAFKRGFLSSLTLHNWHWMYGPYRGLRPGSTFRTSQPLRLESGSAAGPRVETLWTHNAPAFRFRKTTSGHRRAGNLSPPLNFSVILAKMVAWIRCVTQHQSRARFAEVRRGAAPLRPGQEWKE